MRRRISALLVTAGALAAALAMALPASANEVSLGCGLGCSGYGGSYTSPYNTSYTSGTASSNKYNVHDYYVGTTYYYTNGGWTSYDQWYGVWSGASQLISYHNLCNGSFSLCNGLTLTYAA